MRTAIAGTGYVGMLIAVLLAQNNEVFAVDVVQEKVDKINRNESTVNDEYIEKYLKENDLNIFATTDSELAYRMADYVVIAVPINYDPSRILE